jgi:hypothetical protein
MFIGPQGELRDGITIVEAERHGGVQAQDETVGALRDKEHFPVPRLNPM